jgi:hypothetical protein
MEQNSFPDAYFNDDWPFLWIPFTSATETCYPDREFPLIFLSSANQMLDSALKLAITVSFHRLLIESITITVIRRHLFYAVDKASLNKTRMISEFGRLLDCGAV